MQICKINACMIYKMGMKLREGEGGLLIISSKYSSNVQK